MSTDFNTGTIVAAGSFKFDHNVPTDIRTRVSTRSDIADIPMPFIGMQVYVIDEGNIYTITSNCFEPEVDVYGRLQFKEGWESGLDKIASSKNWQSIINNDAFIGPTGPQGPQGPSGADGRIMYYAGEWESGTLYEADDTSTPYVYDKYGQEGYNYFFLVGESYIGDVSPYYDQTHSWKPIPKFEAIYANVGMFDTANVGAAAFYGDYVFSQTSTTGGTNFKDFAVKVDGTIDTSKFNPAIWFNFKTGAGSLAKGNISWNANGKVTLGEDVELKWSNITDAPEIGGEDGRLSLTAVNNEFGPETGEYIWVQDNCTFNGESGWSIWIHENDLDAYNNDEHLNNTIYGAAVYDTGKNTSVGDSCYAGSLYYNDEGEWSDDKAAYTSVKSVNKGNSSLTEADVTDIIQKTEISGTQIKTGTIEGNKIKANSIDASKLNVDSITTSKLDTKPTSSDTTGKITIMNNDIVIYNRSTSNPAITISGDALPNLSSTAPVSPGNKTYSFGGAYAMSSSGTAIKSRKLETITVDANNDLTLSPSIPYDLALEWSDGTEYGYHANVSFGLNFVSSDQTNLFRSTMNFSFNAGRNNDGSGIVLTGGDLIPVIDGNSGFTLMKGKTYDIYEVYFFEFEDVEGDESELFVNFGFKQYETSTTLVKNINIHYEYHTPTDRISELGNDGIRFRHSPYKYFETCGNEMVIQDYHQAMGFNGYGLWMAVAKGDGSDNVIIWSKPRISNGTLTFGTSASTTYQNIRNTMFRH